jgi:hypothetical protein
MKRYRPFLILIVIAAAAILVWELFGPRPRVAHLSGYIVGDNLDLAAPVQERSNPFRWSTASGSQRGRPRSGSRRRRSPLKVNRRARTSRPIRL